MRDPRELDPIITAPEAFMAIARIAAMRSKDPRTKCGACITFLGRSIGIGYNGLTPGMQDLPQIWETEDKYARVEHAERNAIHNADRIQLEKAKQNAEVLRRLPLVDYLENYAFLEEKLLEHPTAELYIWTTRQYLPCQECAKAIAFNGITTVWVDFDPETVLDNPMYDWSATLHIFKCAGVEIKQMTGDADRIFRETPQNEKSTDHGDHGAGRELSDGTSPRDGVRSMGDDPEKLERSDDQQDPEAVE